MKRLWLIHAAGAGCEVLNLYLGAMDGWLRYFDPDDAKVLSPPETRLREMQRAERLAQKLRDSGIDPNSSAPDPELLCAAIESAIASNL